MHLVDHISSRFKPNLCCQQRHHQLTDLLTSSIQRYSLTDYEAGIAMATSGTNPAPTRPPAPIVLVSRGPCDARLIVFDQEYHVHSDVLKLQSEYFFKFLDSPDKENLPSTETRFKYEWVTKVDDDGEGWMLTCAGPKVGHITALLSIFRDMLLRCR